MLLGNKQIWKKKKKVRNQGLKQQQDKNGLKQVEDVQICTVESTGKFSIRVECWVVPDYFLNVYFFYLFFLVYSASSQIRLKKTQLFNQL